MSPPHRSLLTGYSHGVYIDESGLADPRLESVTSLWTSAAVSFPFAHSETVWTGVQHIMAKHFRPGTREIKGAGTPGRLQRGSTLDDASGDLVDLLLECEGQAWVAATHRGVNPMPDRAREVLLEQPKDIARQLLFERLNRYIGCDEDHGKHLLIWDLSHQQELEDFSRFVAGFNDGFYTFQERTPLMAGALLGGLSHDWGGLQVADWFAHMALHHHGRTGTWGQYEDDVGPRAPRRMHARIRPTRSATSCGRRCRPTSPTDCKASGTRCGERKVGGLATKGSRSSQLLMGIF